MTPGVVRTAAALLAELDAVEAALAALDTGGRTAEIEVRGGVGWRKAPVPVETARAALETTAAGVRRALAALGVVQ